MKIAVWGVLVLFLFGNCQKQQPQVSLAFKYTPGEIYHYKIIDTVDYESLAEEGKARNFKQHQEQHSSIHVLEQDSSSIYALRVQFTVEADSIEYAEGEPQDRQDEHKSRVGRTFSYLLHMRADGELTDIKGKNESSTFWYERAYKTSQPVFPGEKVSLGYSWRQTVSVTMPEAEPFSAITTYKITGFEKVFEHDCVVIAFDSKLDISADLSNSKWNKKQHKKWLYQNETTSTGKIYFDYERGVMVRKETLITTRRKMDIVCKDGYEKTYSGIYRDRERFELIDIEQASPENSQYEIAPADSQARVDE